MILILCTEIASSPSAPAPPLQCYHCSTITPEECTGSQNKTVRNCTAGQLCGALVNFRFPQNNSQELIHRFALDCVDAAFCQEDPDACKGGSGGNCTRCCGCDECNDATVNRTSLGISLNNTCPTPTLTPTPTLPPPIHPTLQCYHCSQTAPEECSDPPVRNCTPGEVCHALVNFMYPVFVPPGGDPINQFQLDCVDPAFCEVIDPDECKTKGFGNCFRCCNCSLCNDPTVNQTSLDVSVKTCPIPISTPPPAPTPAVIQCYSCPDETGTCSAANMTENLLVTCQIGCRPISNNCMSST